ncbi:MAG: tryptophan synthase subunit beta [Planctomycetota bacterium]
MSTASESGPALGAFGAYGGRFVSELLTGALDELDRACREVLPSETFRTRLESELTHWAGRPTPLTEAENLSARANLRISLKREDLLHGGAHKTNNVVGQALLAQAMGKRRLIAETGAGQHGVATAMIGARLGLEVLVYMGQRDVERQHLNVERMRLCGARVVPVSNGSATLKDAINEALRDWAASVDSTHYVLGTVCGPDPFPRLVGGLHRCIGDEARTQHLERYGELPDAVLACVGGGSNAIGVFRAFLDEDVRLLGAEPGGPRDASNEHGAVLTEGTPGLLHGARTLVLQDHDGLIRPSRSIAAGLDYPGVGPEHAHLRDTGRAEYHPICDEEALDAVRETCRREGILPALESAHAIALALQAVDRGLLPAGSRVVLNLSGRGDKDLQALTTHAASDRRLGSAAP